MCAYLYLQNGFNADAQTLAAALTLPLKHQIGTLYAGCCEGQLIVQIDGITRRYLDL